MLVKIVGAKAFFGHRGRPGKVGGSVAAHTAGESFNRKWEAQAQSIEIEPGKVAKAKYVVKGGGDLSGDVTNGGKRKSVNATYLADKDVWLVDLAGSLSKLKKHGNRAIAQFYPTKNLLDYTVLKFKRGNTFVDTENAVRKAMSRQFTYNGNKLKSTAIALRGK